MAKILNKFIVIFQTQFHKIVKVVRTDYGTEFNFLKRYFGEKGIVHQTIIAGTPQRN